MTQMYAIYINQMVLFFAKEPAKTLKDFHLLDSETFDFFHFYARVKEKKLQGPFLLINQNPKVYFRNVKKHLQLIEAAGGLVKNENGSYLFIFRRGKWDLPKGKVNPGESTKMTACREVAEECGIQVNKLGKKLWVSWHIYEDNEKLFLKKTSWYAMEALCQTNLKPQLQEDITDARWLAAEQLDLVKGNTYPLIADLIKAHIKKPEPGVA